ncbi:hypothetical protein ACO0R3_001968 [Hanseniaspora guilliermondii]
MSESSIQNFTTDFANEEDSYNGDPDVSSVRDLARSFTNISLNSSALYDIPLKNEDGNLDIEDSKYNSKLDPNSPDFNAHFWMKNLHKIRDTDPDYYKSTNLGLVYKNLSCVGESSDVMYQTTFISILQYFAETLYKKLRPSKPEDMFTILKPMDGILKPGSLNVVLGKPGSGCTTLLKTIAASTYGFKVAKDSFMSYDGLAPKDINKHYRGDVVYQAETDIHFPNLTVFETLKSVALLTTPRNRIKGLTRDQFATHMAEATMAMYGLSHTRNTKVGNEFIRGVSGGERKRVSICEISLINGKIVCYDNSSRGLDSASTLSFIKCLKTASIANDTTAVVAIYQCSQEAYDLFDNVIVLDHGYQLYNGPAQLAKQYFLDMGYVCPDRQTTADFLTAITSPKERIQNKEMLSRGIKIPSTPEEMYNHFKKSQIYQDLLKQIDDYNSNINEETKEKFIASHAAAQSKRAKPSSSYRLSYGLQIKYLLQRNFTRIKNDIGLSVFIVLANSLMALVIASMFYKVMYHTNTSTFFFRGGSLFYAILFNSFSSLLEVMTLYEARSIIEKQKNLAMYHPSAEAIASILSQLPSKLLTNICFNLLFYFLANLRREPGPFFFYLLLNFTCVLTMSHLFRFIGSATKSFPEAMVPGSVVLLALTMYAGFAIPKTKMLGWSKWIYWINPLQYGFESLMINEFHDRNFECSQYVPTGGDYNSVSLDYKTCSAVGAVPGEDFVNGDQFLKLSYGYSHGHKWRGFGVLVGFAIFFFSIYLFFTEFNESAKQKGEIILFPQSIVRKIKKQNKYMQSHPEDLENPIDSKDRANEKSIIDNDDSRSSAYKSKDESSLDSDNVGLSESEATLHWRDLCYDIKIKGETRRILNKVDGWVAKRSITALMGSSGAGKTTLLDCLASRVTMGVVTGKILVNGKQRDNSFPRSIGYCQQQDLHLSTATVRESLRFSAYLRQSAAISKKEKDEYVENVIKILDMEKYAHAVVGVMGEGLNVEQRKRLTIGVELAAKPKLLMFLDEPTSGLDSQTAWSICQLMRKLANQGQAILCTIHQPSAILIQEFDRLLFLQPGGKTAYFGDLGDGCKTMIKYFESKGAEKCPPDANPAEWMLDIVQARDYHEAWRQSDEFKEVKSTLEEMERELPKIQMTEDKYTHASFAASFWLQYKLVFIRVMQQNWRTPFYLWSKFFLVVYSEIFIGFTFFKADHTLQGLQNQMLAVFMFTVLFNPYLQQYLPVFKQQRDLYEARERPSRTFSWVAFITAQMAAEIPSNFASGCLAFFCYFYPIGFYQNASNSGQLSERSGLFFLYSIAFFIYTGSFAVLVASPFDDPQAGGHISSIIFTMALAFNGVFVGPNEMPGFWKFMYRVSPMTYLVDGLLSVGIANNNAECSTYEFRSIVPPENMTCGEYLDPYLKAAGTGYLLDSGNAEVCKLCSVSSTNAFLSSVSSKYSRRWRNFGIFLAYIVFDYACTIFVYWLARVPKKSSRVKEQSDASVENSKSDVESKKN